MYKMLFFEKTVYQAINSMICVFNSCIKITRMYSNSSDMQFFVYLLCSTVLKINDITNWIDEYTQNIPLKLLYISFETFKFI